MTGPTADRGAPRTYLQQQLRVLVARQRAQATAPADRSAQRLAAALAPTPTDSAPEEGQP